MTITRKRSKIAPQHIERSIEILRVQIGIRLVEKGDGTLSSSHEILGIVTEEYWELVEAVKKGDLTNVSKELLDIAVACVFGMACNEAEQLDW